MKVLSSLKIDKKTFKAGDFLDEKSIKLIEEKELLKLVSEKVLMVEEKKPLKEVVAIKEDKGKKKEKEV